MKELIRKISGVIMWILLAFASAFFAGITSILAKCGIKKTDSDVAMAFRTIIVLIFSWIMVFITGSWKDIGMIGSKTWIFLILSGLATGASWLCYFRALQIGNINKVVAVDKSSVVLTMVIAIVFLKEDITLIKAIAIILIGAGTYLMVGENSNKPKGTEKSTWIIYAVLSAVFASLTTILGKIGITHIESNLGTAIRTFVVLIMAWILVFASGKKSLVSSVPKKEIIFISLSGVATGASWLCYYKALQGGYASVVVPIDKLSILVTIAFSYIAFKEKLSKKAILGLICMVCGTLMMII